jgi:uncharacterized protein (TIGR02466 family)
MQVASLFATPAYVVQVPDAPALAASLATAIVACRDGGGGVSRSNVGGWQSDTDMLAWGGEPAHRLASVIEHASGAITQPVDGAGAARWRAQMWANINGAGDSNQTHWHPGSFLSFVFYVDDGYAGSADKALGGELVFVDPRMPFLRMRTPDLRHRGPGGATEEQETWIRPYTGLLIAFPSFLGHSVRPYMGAGRRISIAVNMMARTS